MEGRIRFNEQAFVGNYDYLRSRVIGETGAVVKADAYGTGSKRATRLLSAEGCRHFFVANIQEAVDIKSYANGAIYVLSGPASTQDAERIANLEFIPVLNSKRQIQHWMPFRDRRCAVHIDTGMQRLGISPRDCLRMDVSSLNVGLVMTHLACADTPEHPMNRAQIHEFTSILSNFGGVPTSIGNSAGILNGTEFQGDITRPGIALYGGNPWRDRTNPLSNVVTCEGVVLQVRTVCRGQSVGYGATYVAQDSIRVATIGLGYADGIPRCLSNRGSVAFDGVRMPIVGNISMDSTQIDCSNQPKLQEGDYVQFVGDAVPIDEVARLADTISYEILTNFGSRFERV